MGTPGKWVLAWSGGVAPVLVWEDEMPGHCHGENPEDVILASSSGNGHEATGDPQIICPTKRVTPRPVYGA